MKWLSNYTEQGGKIWKIKKKNRENTKKIEGFKRKLIAQREEKFTNQARVIFQTDGKASNMVRKWDSSESFIRFIGRVGIINQLVVSNKEIDNWTREW